jgi:hypothetical protein
MNTQPDAESAPISEAPLTLKSPEHPSVERQKVFIEAALLRSLVRRPAR